jgi:hypothetical protein
MADSLKVKFYKNEMDELEDIINELIKLIDFINKLKRELSLDPKFVLLETGYLVPAGFKSNTIKATSIIKKYVKNEVLFSFKKDIGRLSERIKIITFHSPSWAIYELSTIALTNIKDELESKYSYLKRNIY